MKLVKTKTQKKFHISLAKPWFDEGEPRAAYQVIKSKWLISGPKVEEFEKAFAARMKVKYAVAVQSGSAALLVAQQALGVSSGDEVIVPNMTFISTATACMYLGAKPVFADIEMKTYGMDPSRIEKLINKNTKGIVPVHYAGQSCDLVPILKIAKKHKLFVLEDAAEAHDAKYRGKPVGGWGDAGIFSFTPSKPMTTGEGGMITTNDKKLADKCRLLRNFHDIGKFQWQDLGFHFRMPEMMGAIGLVQLKKLSKAITLRRKIAAQYTKGLGEFNCIITPHVRKLDNINFQLYTVRLILEKLAITRDQFIDELNSKGVQARLYYPCLHRQNVFFGIGRYQDVDFPNSMLFAKSVLSLPIYPDLKKEEIDYIIDCIKEIVTKYKKT